MNPDDRTQAIAATLFKVGEQLIAVMRSVAVQRKAYMQERERERYRQRERPFRGCTAVG